MWNNLYKNPYKLTYYSTNCGVIYEKSHISQLIIPHFVEFRAGFNILKLIFWNGHFAQIFRNPMNYLGILGFSKRILFHTKNFFMG